MTTSDKGSTGAPSSNVPASAGIRAEDRRLGSLRVHIAYPAAAAEVGVLLYPTIMGLDDTMRRLAADFAVAGMTAVVWDPYDGEDGTDNIPEMLQRSKQCEDGAVVRDLGVIVDHIEGELGLASVAGIGWCFGGRIGLLHAGSDPRVAALASYNPTIWSPTPIEIREGFTRCRTDFPGQTMDEFALSASVRGPVQVSRPEHDLTQAREYEKLLDVLFGRSDPTFYEYYPKATHGFSYTPGEVNAKAHRYAWAATLSMFSSGL